MTQEPFLLSGEFHYFRVPRAAWPARLHSMADAGLETASIYVPWNWHAPAPDAPPDFEGRSVPERDLKGALEAIADAGLTCVFRPGPFITGEWRNGGIPDWFIDRHHESLAVDANGRYPGVGRFYPVITYAHGAYMAATQRWLDAVFTLAQPYLASRGGPIDNVQLDDEPSYWQCIWKPLAVDYNPVLVEAAGGEPSRFAQWLLERAGSLDALNDRYGTSWSRAGDVDPPRQAMRDLAELPRFLDWLDFKLAEINDHIGFLHRTAVDAGVDVRCSMLHPYLLPVSALSCSRYVVEHGLPLQFTNECYLKLFATSTAAEHKLGAVLSVHETYHMWRVEENGPPVTMELQGSLSSYLTPGAMEVLYALTVARGMRGINYFMMVGGANPRGFEGHTGAEYDVSSPIAADGAHGPQYDVIAKLSRMVRGWIDTDLAGATVLRDVWLGCYQPYEAALCSAPEEILGLHGFDDAFNAGDIGQAEVGSLASLFACNSISFGCIDLESTEPDELASVRQLWIPGGPFLSRAVEERLATYVESGGHLVVMPGLPVLDEAMRPCSVLSDLVLDADAPEATSEVTGATALYGDMGEVVVASGTLRRWTLPAGATPLLQDGAGAVCAFSRPVGKGGVTVLGFNLHYGATAGDGQHEFVRRLVESEVGELAASAAPRPAAAFQLQGDDAGVVCVINPVELPVSARVRYTTPAGGRRALPLRLAGIEFQGRGARLLPVSLALGGGVVLVQATWELLERVSHPHEVVLEFACPTPRGEVVLRGVTGVPDVHHGSLVEQTAAENGEQVLILEAEGGTLELVIATPALTPAESEHPNPATSVK
jgi:beta-galactosidase